MPEERTVMLADVPALASAKKASIIPVTVPRNPSMGAPAAVVESHVKPFVRLVTSMLPVFSIATSTSFMGRPMRFTPLRMSRA